MSPAIASLDQCRRGEKKGRSYVSKPFSRSDLLIFLTTARRWHCNVRPGIVRHYLNVPTSPSNFLPPPPPCPSTLGNTSFCAASCARQLPHACIFPCECVLAFPPSPFHFFITTRICSTNDCQDWSHVSCVSQTRASPHACLFSLKNVSLSLPPSPTLSPHVYLRVSPLPSHPGRNVLSL